MWVRTVTKARIRLLAVVVIALLGALGWSLVTSRTAEVSRDRTGLFTTLPILWNESADLAGMLKSDAAPHWAKVLIEGGGAVAPLDALASADGRSMLTGLRYLVLAQPRPLSPPENVALDAWVRGGGRLLLLADPLLSEDTIYALGDKRRPQDVVLLSPILKRWGLELQFDDGQAFAESQRDVMGITLPVNMPGRLEIADRQPCRSWGEGLAATCRLGRGRVLVLADAALIERDDPTGTRAKSLKLLLDAAFIGN